MVLAFVLTLSWVGFIVFVAVKRSWLRGVSSYKNIKCSPQCYLRGSRNSVAKAVVEHIQKSNPDACADPKTIEKVVDLIDTYTSIKYSKIESEICKGYDAYDPMVHHHNSNTFSVDAETSSAAKDTNDSDSKEPEVAMDEDTFLTKIVKLLEEANFKPLTKKELDFAIKENYTITVPMNNDWEKLDSEMISSYYKQSGEKASIDNGDKVLIFHRGITLDVIRDRLIWEKIDVLLAYLLGKLTKVLKPFIGMLMSNKDSNASAAGADADAPDTLDMTEPFEDKVYKPSAEEIKARTASVPRVRLDEKVLTPNDFFNISRVQEPAYEEVFVLWRGKHDSQSVGSLSLHGLADNIPDDSNTTPRFIFSKYMRGIPFADVNLAYPEMDINMKPFDFILNSRGTLLSIVALLTIDLYNTQGSFSFLRCLVLGAIGIYIGALMSFFSSMAFYKTTVYSSVNNHTLGNNRCSIQNLVNSARMQEFKEAAIAYSAIVGSGKEMSLAPSRVSGEASKIIDAYDCDRIVNPVQSILDSEDALRKLFDLKIARLDFATNTVIAVPPEEAVKLLNEAIEAEAKAQMK